MVRSTRHLFCVIIGCHCVLLWIYITYITSFRVHCKFRWHKVTILVYCFLFCLFCFSSALICIGLERTHSPLWHCVCLGHKKKTEQKKKKKHSRSYATFCGIEKVLFINSQSPKNLFCKTPCWAPRGERSASKQLKNRGYESENRAEGKWIEEEPDESPLGSTAVLSNSELSDLMRRGHEVLTEWRYPSPLPQRNSCRSLKPRRVFTKSTKPQRGIFVFNSYRHMYWFRLFCFEKRWQEVHVLYHNTASEIICHRGIKP